MSVPKRNHSPPTETTTRATTTTTGRPPAGERCATAKTSQATAPVATSINDQESGVEMRRQLAPVERIGARLRQGHHVEDPAEVAATTTGRQTPQAAPTEHD